MKKRCSWVTDDPLYIAYHDEEWGRPSHDEQHLFEMLLLEGVQAGLSWITILRRREAYRRAFDGFDVVKIAAYDQAKVEALLQDASIIRNRRKVVAFVQNAQAWLQLQSEGVDMVDYLWNLGGRGSAGDGKVEAEAMSKALKAKGFTFVGPTICLSFMQACGMVDGHENCDWRGWQGQRNLDS